MSAGELDVVKRAFFKRGEVEFTRVAMQPGMPQAFGTFEGKPYFGLPGNPVSVFVSFEMFVRPALLKLAGRRDLDRLEVTAVLEDEISGPKGKTTFARVRVRRTADGLTARSAGGRCVPADRLPRFPSADDYLKVVRRSAATVCMTSSTFFVSLFSNFTNCS